MFGKIVLVLASVLGASGVAGSRVRHAKSSS